MRGPSLVVEDVGVVLDDDRSLPLPKVGKLFPTESNKSGMDTSAACSEACTGR